MLPPPSSNPKSLLCPPPPPLPAFPLREACVAHHSAVVLKVEVPEDLQEVAAEEEGKGQGEGLSSKEVEGVFGPPGGGGHL